MESRSRRRDINLACWIWPGYPALNREYKTIVKTALFAQMFVKLWSCFLKQRGWLKMISIYFTLMWFEGLFKDPSSRNNEEFQAHITLLPNLVVLNDRLAKKWRLDLLIFPLLTGLPITWSLKNWYNQLLYSREMASCG